MASKRDGRARSGRKSESEMPVGSPPAQEESASRPGGPPVAPTPMATVNAEPQPAASEIGPVAIQPRAEAAGGGPTEPSSPAAGGSAGPSSTRDLEPPTDSGSGPQPVHRYRPQARAHLCPSGDGEAPAPRNRPLSDFGAGRRDQPVRGPRPHRPELADRPEALGRGAHGPWSGPGGYGPRRADLLAALPTDESGEAERTADRPGEPPGRRAGRRLPFLAQRLSIPVHENRHGGEAAGVRRLRRLAGQRLPGQLQARPHPAGHPRRHQPTPTNGSITSRRAPPSFPGSRRFGS